MTRLPVSGGDNGTWGTILNDFLLVGHNPDGTLKLPPSVPSNTFVVHVEGAETINGVKTFVDSPIVPTPTSNTEVANKQYVDNVSTSGAPDADATTKGILQLAGDLSGTATSPTVPGLANKVDTSLVGTANGVASLDNGGKVPATQLPSQQNADWNAVSGVTQILNKPTIPTLSDATSSTKGVVQLSGDLSGTADTPTVPGLTGKLDKNIATTKGDMFVATGSATIVRLGVGSDGQVLTADSSLADGVKWATPTGGGGGSLWAPQFSYAGNLQVTTGTFRIYNDFGISFTISKVRASVGVAPLGQSAIIDVLVNGTNSLFSDTAHKPTIAAAGNTAVVTPDAVTTFANGDYLTVNINQIGTTNPGADLSVTVTLQ